MKIVGIIGRLILTAALLVIAAHHVHWSVVTSLTLLSINAELTNWLISRKRG